MPSVVANRVNRSVSNAVCVNARTRGWGKSWAARISTSPPPMTVSVKANPVKYASGTSMNDHPVTDTADTEKVRGGNLWGYGPP